MQIKLFRFCVFLIILLLFRENGKAQDPHFSQYFASPVTLNPALIGKGVEDIRVSSILRAQWWGASGIQPFYTTTVALEKRLLVNRPVNSSLAVAISLLSDASNGGILKNNFLSGGIAYNQALDAEGNEFLGAGMSVTYASRIFDASKFQFQSQFGSMGFQRSIPSNDPVAVAGRHYWDVNAGVHYSKKNNRLGYTIGAAVFHAGTPTEAEYNGEEYKLSIRTSLQAGMQFYMENKGEIHVSGMADIQGINRIYTAGVMYKMPINDATMNSFNIGVWKRFRDAIYPYVALEGNTWLAGVSYDILTGNDRTFAQSVQSLEFSFILKFGSAKKTSSSVNSVIFY
jgi:type IX secretion system PorP/SprF family membrane protein